MNLKFACTIVSVYPFGLNEVKPGIHPGHFMIDKVLDPDKDFVILQVGESISYVYIDITRGTMQVRVSSAEIANAVVNDFCNAQLAITDDARPGLFWVEGALSKDDILKNYVDKLKEARKVQRNWWQRLVTLADDDWNKYRQHLSITDLQRFGAKVLGLEREYLIIPKPLTASCPACMMPVNDQALICPHCRYILKKDKVKKEDFATV